jgi:uncharacterized repeat protein (TIGR01451 family)
MKNLTVSTLIAATVFAASAATAFAGNYGTDCQAQYGTSNCSTTNIVVNKTVQNPSTKNYVDNLGANDPKYKGGQTVPFKITVTNTGTATLNNVIITDTLPQYTTGVETKGGQISNNAVTITVDKLNAGESKTFDLNAKVVDEKTLPADKGIICVINKAKSNSDSATSYDEAQFCIEKPVIGIKNPPTTKGGLPVHSAPETTITPKTGPEMLALIGLLPTGAAGFILRRRSINK